MIVFEALEADELQELERAPPFGRADPTRDLAPDDRVGKHRTPGKEIIGLEHEAAVAAWSRDRAAVEFDLPGACRLEAGDDAQKRGLAAARGADDGNEFTALDHEVDVVQRLQFAERLAEMGNLQLRRQLALILGPGHEPVFEPTEACRQRDAGG